MMKIFLAFLLCSSFFQPISQLDVYEALRGDSVELLDSTIEELESANDNSLANAYRGTLLMMKAGYLNKPADRIKIFKEGHALLEAQILSLPNQVELRFLRFIIQENAPKILGYRMNLSEDAAFIIDHYKSLTDELKHQIDLYVETSDILDPSDFDG